MQAANILIIRYGSLKLVSDALMVHAPGGSDGGRLGSFGRVETLGFHVSLPFLTPWVAQGSRGPPGLAFERSRPGSRTRLKRAQPMIRSFFGRRVFGFCTATVLLLGYAVTTAAPASSQLEEVPYIVSVGRYFIEIVAGIGTALDTYGKVKAALPSRPLTGREEYALGSTYLRGIHGHGVDYKEARDHFLAAVHDHYYRGWIGLGIMYLTGKIAALEERAISPEDRRMAEQHFFNVINKPETAGDRVAEYDLGVAMEQAPVKNHYRYALYWYAKSSAQNFAPAASAISRICAMPEGVSGNLGPPCIEFHYRPKLVPLKTIPVTPGPDLEPNIDSAYRRRASEIQGPTRSLAARYPLDKADTLYGGLPRQDQSGPRVSACGGLMVLT